MKYRVTFELELYATSTGQAYAEAMDHLAAVIQKHRQQLMWVALERVGELPNGGIDWAPHGDRLDGWRCLYTIDEVKP